MEHFFGAKRDAAADAVVQDKLQFVLSAPELKFNGTFKKAQELDQPDAAQFVQELLRMGQAGSDCTREWVAALQNFYRTHSVNMTRGSQKPPDMLGPRQAFPMIRRVALAQLVRAWLTRMHRQLPENLETDLQDLFFEVRMVVYKRPP